jgi:uncharacterized protein YajQ (UPF0234 family)
MREFSPIERARQRLKCAVMPSFDAVVEPNLVELRNACDQAAKEINTRFDFKGSSAGVEVAEKIAKEREITLHADSDFQIAQVRDVLLAKLTKRGVDARYLSLDAKIEKIGGDKVKQVLKVRSGIESEQAKKITRLVKDSKLKVQAAVQGGELRVSAKKRDDLQATIALVRGLKLEQPLQYLNFRE